MELYVHRFPSQPDHTLGGLFIGNAMECFTLEDEQREVKVPGETRIPDGRYRVRLYTQGTKHAKYLAKFGAEWHRGMLMVCDVPGFVGILIHIGNTDDDTEGCLLVGNMAMANGQLAQSEMAYKQFYPKVRDELTQGRDVFITYKSVHV